MSDLDLIYVPKPYSVSIHPEPAHNGIFSLNLLNKSGCFTGLSDWITDTYRQMTVEEIYLNRLVTLGFYYITVPDKSLPSFPQYLQYLENRPDTWFKDQLLSKYSHFIYFKKNQQFSKELMPFPIDLKRDLATKEAYIDFLGRFFSIDNSDNDIEGHCWELLQDLPELKKVVTRHLNHMWEKYLEPEWTKQEQVVAEAMDEFHSIDLSNMNRLEAIQLITGHDIAKEWSEWPWKLKWIELAERLTFFPSPHVGPYLGVLKTANQIWMPFGINSSANYKNYSKNLDRAEILVRLNALSDDTRLKIMQILSAHIELSSIEIMHQLDLSQSAASRHLKQLSANRFLVERRQGSAKYYSLNRDLLKDTFHSILNFLDID